ncbi:MAG: transporter substrate-binding domain-containing protein [Candidatus Promineifilaceae bacterium]|jgi:polar amino acid transport system substrate-binding protein
MADELNAREGKKGPPFPASLWRKSEKGQGNIVLIIILAVVALIAIGALVWFLFFRGDDETAEGEPTITPTLEEIAPPATEEPTVPPTDTAVPTEDQIWAKIVEEGKLTVGLSADYPPFEFYSRDFLLDGFDVALIREIGSALGLEIEIKDMAFDGLFGSLILNNIDAAISAISVTPERQGKVAFSNIYFVSEDAVLANEDSRINSIPTIEEMAFLRVGVQRGSVYDSWLTTNLVERGLMPEENLHRYQLAGTAVDDLIEGLIDLVVLDLEPANLAVEQGGVKLVGQGLNPQRFAIAVPHGAPQLLNEINKALTQLQINGVVGDLVEKYMGLDEGDLPPIPTPLPPQPTPTPDPNQECIDDMSSVQDLSYDDLDGTNPPQMSPGQPFQKGWRVRNTGSCTWDQTYSLVPVGGNTPAARMGGTPVFVQGVVEPGQTFDFWSNLVAPLAPGAYREYWTMRNTNSGILFGDRVWVMVEVVSNPTPTPMPTQTPSPQIIFFADPIQINQGGSSTLNWATENVREVYLYPQGTPWQGNGVVGSGQRTVYPATTTTYELRVVKNNGTVEIRSTTVFVTPVANAPVITRFTAEPGQIVQGSCVLLTWVVNGANTTNLFRDNVMIWPSAPTNGSVQDCPPNTSGQIIYSLEARGTGGTTWAQDNVSVTPQPTPTPVPTSPPQATATPVPPTATPQPSPTPPPPAIEYFTVEPGVIQVNQCVYIAWGVVGSTDLIQVSRDGAIIYDQAPFNGLEQYCSFPQPGTFVFSITASNSAGQSDSRTASVVVNASLPQNPLADTQWQLESYNVGTGETPVIENSIVTAAFLVDYEITGVGGCNTYSGSYEASSSNVEIILGASTQIVCGSPAGIMEQENAYLSLLPLADTFQIVEGQTRQLTVSSSAGQVILTYTEIVASPF